MLLSAILVSVLIFFALTRTQVGRDGLRRQIMRSFSAQYEGRLEIDRLSGNLVNDLFAGGVRLFDARGRLVLAADSVVAKPRWRDLIRRRVSLGRLTLYRPELSVALAADGEWNLTRSLRQREPGSPSRSDPWSFTSLDVRVIDGSVEISNAGARPAPVAAGHLFDYTRASAENVQIRATVDWRAASRIVEVQSVEAHLTSLGLDLAVPRAQLVLEEDEVLLPLLDFRLGESNGMLAGSLGGLDALRAGDYGAVSLQARLDDANLDADELRRILPGLPVRERIATSFRVQGPLSALVIEEARLAYGDSRLSLEGFVEGLPASADFEVALRDARVRAADVQAVWPSFDASQVSHLGLVTVSVEGRGLVPIETGSEPHELSIYAAWSASAAPGSMQGQLRIRPGTTHRFAYEASLTTAGLDPGGAVDVGALAGSVSGRLALKGETDDFEQHFGTLSARLAPSSVGGRMLDTLTAEFSVAGRDVRGVAYARRASEGLSARLVAQLGAVPTYDMTISGHGLDGGHLLQHDSLLTDVNGSLRIAGGGRTWDTFRGQISFAMDSSLVRLGGSERVVHPQQTRITIADEVDGGARVDVQGDILEASMTATTNPKVLMRVAGLWTRLLAQSVYRDLLKPYPDLALAAPDAEDVSLARLERDLSEELLRVIAQHRPTGEVGFAGFLRVKDAAAISAMLPELPLLETDLSAEFSFRSDASMLGGNVSLTADSLSIGTTDIRGLFAEARMSGPLGATRQDGPAIHVTASARQIEQRDRAVLEPYIDLAIENGDGHMHFSAGDSVGESLRFGARLDTRDDRTVLTLDRFRYANGDYVWLHAESGEVDLYRGAAVFHDLRIVNEDTTQALPQHIRLNGAVSSSPGDTLFLAAENVALHQATRAMGGLPLGGAVDGRLAITGGIQRPELTGRIDVRRFQLDNRLIGDLSIRSSYVPGLPDVHIDATLAPSPEPIPPYALDGIRPLLVEENALNLAGRFRMPEFDERGRQRRASVLDLTLDAERVDAFFFEYIFRELSDVSGDISGSGRITGSLDNPVFDVALHLEEAAFSVPDYNLHFTATADAVVDREGIHIANGFLTDKTGGTARVDGDIQFNDYRFFSFDLAARLDELQIIDVTDSRSALAFYGRIWASGDASLTGPLSNALLQSSNVVTAPRSEVFIPLTEVAAATDPGFIIFADSAGNVPDFYTISHRQNLLARRPVGERPFVDALGMDLNIFAAQGTTVHLVIDPLLGDMMNAVGSGRIQLVRSEGEYLTFGALDVSAGDYLFTAGDVFMRRFLIDEGTIRWDGDPTDPQLNVRASYRTRASTAGLPGLAADAESAPLIPLLVRLHITERVSSPAVGLSLALERRDQDVVGQGVEAVLNDPERSTQYATSVLLTNTFLLTTDQFGDSEAGAGGTRGQFAFNSVSQLVANQINRYLSYALPNVDVNFGLQGERAQDLDVTYGVALRLMDERLVIRGEGVYQNDQQNPTRGEFLVQVRLSPGVSVEMFYRREGDILSDQTLTNTTGAGVSYETRFSNWDRLIQRLFGWMRPEPAHEADDADEEDESAVAAQ